MYVKAAPLTMTMAILVMAIALTVDLLFAHLEKLPPGRRHVFVAALMTLLITFRITERLLEGTL